MSSPVSAPVISSITFDQPGGGYVPGSLITATVTYVAGVSSAPATQTFTGTATDSVTGQAGNLTVNFTVAATSADATSVTVSDSGSRTWSKTSDNGSAATFTAAA